MVSFIQALRYPLGQTGWFKRILPLALLQFIPVVGQMILIGYGMEVARTVYTGQNDLPRLRPIKAFRDGGLFVLTGLLYLVPLLALIPTILIAGTDQGNPTGSAAALIRVVIPIGLTLSISALAGRLRTQNKWVKNIIMGVVGLVPLLVIVSMAASISSVQFSPGAPLQLNAVGIILSTLLGFLVFLIFIVLHVSGVRYAIENKGLFDIAGTVKLLRQKPKLTRFLVVNSILIIVFTAITLALGIVLLIIPALFAWVFWVIVFWYLLVDFLSSSLLPNIS
ncbi:MAG: DUF4013 domain-containing protein [Chloroflexi bacterium]|nr:DUF4013 domain-containing protein [Chloroflexota bacterium]